MIKCGYKLFRRDGGKISRYLKKNLSNKQNFSYHKIIKLSASSIDLIEFYRITILYYRVSSLQKSRIIPKRTNFKMQENSKHELEDDAQRKKKWKIKRSGG